MDIEKLKKINFFTLYRCYNKINIDVWGITKNHPLTPKRMGLREIARGLNEKDVTTTRSGKWYTGTIKYILENPPYKGIAHYKDNEVKNKELALV